MSHSNHICQFLIKKSSPGITKSIHDLSKLFDELDFDSMFEDDSYDESELSSIISGIVDSKALS